MLPNRAPRLYQNRKVLRAAILVGSVLMSLTMAEVLLRALGFSYHLYPEKVQFGWPDPTIMEALYKPDPDLFWVVKNYEQQLKFARWQQPEMIFMGDSCTEYGQFFEPLVGKIESIYPQKQAHYFNFGTAGWSSYQGLRQLERDIIPLEPRILFIRFGVNDLWRGFGLQDKQVSELTRSPMYKLQNLRLVQLFNWAWVSRTSASPDAETINGHLPRVSPDDFRQNLERMIRIARRHDIRPVLVTAPTGYERGNEPEYLAERHLKDLSMLIPLMRKYAEIVREVADRMGVPLCDLRRHFKQIPIATRQDHYFLKDCIHLSPEGDQVVAGQLFECMRKYGLIEELFGGAAPRDGKTQAREDFGLRCPST